MPLNIDWQQILLHLFNLTLLFAILYFVLYRPVQTYLDNRRSAVEEALRRKTENERAVEEALARQEELRRAADERLADYEATRRAEIDRQTASLLEEARQSADKLLTDARAASVGERDRLMLAAREEIARLAADMVTRVGDDSPSDAFDRFLNQAEKGGGEYAD